MAFISKTGSTQLTNSYQQITTVVRPHTFQPTASMHTPHTASWILVRHINLECTTIRMSGQQSIRCVYLTSNDNRKAGPGKFCSYIQVLFTVYVYTYMFIYIHYFGLFKTHTKRNWFPHTPLISQGARKRKLLITRKASNYRPTYTHTHTQRYTAFDTVSPADNLSLQKNVTSVWRLSQSVNHLPNNISLVILSRNWFFHR